jgi:hypothetical protein
VKIIKMESKKMTKQTTAKNAGTVQIVGSLNSNPSTSTSTNSGSGFVPQTPSPGMQGLVKQFGSYANTAGDLLSDIVDFGLYDIINPITQGLNHLGLGIDQVDNLVSKSFGWDELISDKSRSKMLGNIRTLMNERAARTPVKDVLSDWFENAGKPAFNSGNQPVEENQAAAASTTIPLNSKQNTPATKNNTPAQTNTPKHQDFVDNWVFGGYGNPTIPQLIKDMANRDSGIKQLVSKVPEELAELLDYLQNVSKKPVKSMPQQVEEYMGLEGFNDMVSNNLFLRGLLGTTELVNPRQWDRVIRSVPYSVLMAALAPTGAISNAVTYLNGNEDAQKFTKDAGNKISEAINYPFNLMKRNDDKNADKLDKALELILKDFTK